MKMGFSKETLIGNKTMKAIKICIWFLIYIYICIYVLYIFFVIVFVMFGIKSCFCVTAGGSLQRFEKSTKRICLYLLTYLYLSMDFNLYFHRKYICIFIENIFVFLFTGREQPAAFWTKHQKDRQGG